MEPRAKTHQETGRASAEANAKANVTEPRRRTALKTEPESDAANAKGNDAARTQSRKIAHATAVVPNAPRDREVASARAHGTERVPIAGVTDQ